MIDIDKFNESWTRPILYRKTVGSDQLLICAGDSWTWGDSLGKINDPSAPDHVWLPDDFEWRTTHIYGALIADRLGTDFVNLGIPGHSNIEIIDNTFLKLIPSYRPHYRKITLVFTLTELCRELLGDSVWTNKITSYASVNDFLMQYEKLMFDTIMFYQEQYPDIEIRVGRNFTYTFPENMLILGHRHFDKTWIDVIADHTKQSNYPPNIRVLSQMGTGPLIQFFEKQTGQFQLYKSKFVDILTDSLDATTWLNESPCFYKKATKHPTEEGHKLWADYIYNSCKDILNA